MRQNYTAAIVGCGYQLAGVEIVGVVDPLEVARAQYREEYGIERDFASVEEMLAEVAPDLVSVCTWHLLHPAPTIAAARAGVKGVICEKPMAVGLEAFQSKFQPALDAFSRGEMSVGELREATEWDRRWSWLCRPQRLRLLHRTRQSLLQPFVKMAGQFGNHRVTARNLEIVQVDVDRNLLFINGGVPGPSRGLILIKRSRKSGK